MLLTMGMIALVFSILKKSSFQKNARKYSWLLFACFGGYTVLSVITGLYLQNLLPVYMIQPWISLLIFVVGATGLKFLFLRK
jgi:putative Mn2+ efflux pump MntP